MKTALSVLHPAHPNPYFLKTWLILRVPVAVVAAAYVILNAHEQWYAAAAIVSLAGEALQLWCFASLSKNKELTVRGPYALVRNPMYLGRYLVLLGCVLLLDSPPLVGIYTVAYYFYLQFRVQQEEERLDARFPEVFRDYCAHVHRFLPRLTAYCDNPVLYFSGRLFMKNHGLWNAIGVLAFYAAVAWRVW